MFDRASQVELEVAIVAAGAVDRDPIGRSRHGVEACAPTLIALTQAGIAGGDGAQGVDCRSRVDREDGVEAGRAGVQPDRLALARRPGEPDRMSAWISAVVGLTGLLGGEAGRARPIPADRSGNLVGGREIVIGRTTIYGQ